MLAARAPPMGTVLTGDERVDVHRLRAIILYGFRTRLSILLHRWNQKILGWRAAAGKRMALYGDIRTPAPTSDAPPAHARALASAERAVRSTEPPPGLVRILTFNHGGSAVAP